MIAVVALAVGFVDSNIHGHAVPAGQFGTKGNSQLPALASIQFGRQGHDPFAGRPRILPVLGQFGGIPQRAALGTAAIRRDDFGRNYTPFPGVVMDKAGAFIDQLGTRTIGSSGDG